MTTPSLHALTDRYHAQLRAEQAPGEALPSDPDSHWQRLLRALAVEFAQTELRALALREEADPRTAYELLPDWERVVGEPDPCAGAAATLQERRLRVVQKLTARGGQSRAFYLQLAGSLGYRIEIEEFRPFVAGRSRCGHRLADGPNGDGHSARFVWRVTVPDPRFTAFRAGVSQAGDRLLSIARAVDLECVLRRAAPAHTVLIFDYQGA